MGKHKYGYDITEDMRELYGKDYEQINNIRVSLAESVLTTGQTMCNLMNIIQNPIPIRQQELDKWIEDKDVFLTNINRQCDLIASFVKEYHIK
ncbi:hypothetical protein [Clostridium botulinum]|uniref:hypothetical protein n=1 Tax=Clostridium botulinum TaxID=1491 RepID=UPI0004BABCC4|nr:hypothetical protein [Clostridium botulinum]QDY27041.1 hypothetical protein CGQ40_20265 [Clostridium botulinum]